jgi:NADPH:quinone reductase
MVSATVGQEVRTMRSVVLREHGGPDALRLEQAPVPEPGPGQVLIAAEAIGVGHAQVQIRRDEFPAAAWRPPLPTVLGGDVVGRIGAVGPGVGGVAVGDRVGAFVLAGAYADQVLAPADALVLVPDALDAAVATVLPGTGPIAAGLLDVGGPVAGRTVLVHAAAGGVGHLALQLARVLGAGTVIGTAGSAAKLAFIRAMGADAAVDYTRSDWVDEVRELTGGGGVDLILDGVGGGALLDGVGLLAPGGRLVFYGSAAGREVPPISALALMGLKSVTGFNLSAWRQCAPRIHRERLAELTDLLGTGRVRAQVHARFGLDQAGPAHAAVEERTALGRVVIVP